MLNGSLTLCFCRKIQVVLLLGALFSISLDPLVAENRWEPVGPSGAEVQALVIDPVTSSTLYAGTIGGGGMFCSTDGGDNWSAINNGLTERDISKLAIDPLAPTTLYAGTFRGVFKTTNGGKSWTEVGESLPQTYVWSLAIDPHTPSTLYVAVVGGVFRSKDAGITWAALNDGLPSLSVSTLAIDPFNPTTLYAGTSGAYAEGLFRSTDAGQTWTMINDGLDLSPPTGFSDLTIDPLTPSSLYVLANGGGTGGGRLYRSTNYGDTWTGVNIGTGFNSISALAVDPLTPSTLYVQVDGDEGHRLLRSTDSGHTWTVVLDGQVWSVAIDPLNSSILYVGTEWIEGQRKREVLRSSDGGDTWSPASKGLAHHHILALAIDPLNPATLYAGTSGKDFESLLRSRDGGKSWTTILGGFAFLPVYAIAIDPFHPSTLYVGTREGVFRSREGGDNWAAVNNGLTQLKVDALAIDPTTPTTLYAGTDYGYYGGGIFRSTDGGDSWTAVNEGLALLDRYIRALAVDPMTPSTLYAGTCFFADGPEGGVFRSTDDGESWTAVNQGLPNLGVWALAIDHLNPSTLYAGTPGGGVFRSRDAGGSWTATNSGLGNLWVETLVVDPRNRSTLYAGTSGGGVFRSRDGGDTWEAFNNGLTELQVSALAVDPLDPSTLYAGTIGGGVFVSRPEARSLFFPQFANGIQVAQHLQYQSTLILVNSGLETTVKVGLYSTPDGSPMQMALGEMGAGSTFGLHLDQGESISLPTTGTGALQSGYLQIDATEEVEGVLVLKRSDLATGLAMYEVGVPASTPMTEFSMFVDSTGVRNTGVAIVYPLSVEEETGSQGEDANVKVTLYDTHYNLIAERNLDPIAPGYQMSRFVYEMFADPFVRTRAQEVEGLITVKSDQPLAAVTLRQQDDPIEQFPQDVPILTAFPVMPGIPDHTSAGLATESSFFFPQFADGILGAQNLQHESTLILVNYGPTTSVRVEFHRTPDGEPIEVTLGELGSDSTFEFELAQGQSTSLSTGGTGVLKTGYVRVAATNAVKGLLIFKRSDLKTGIQMYEAGVPTSERMTEFCLFVDSLGVRDTGLAILNPPLDEEPLSADPEDARVTIRLHDKQYNLIAEKTLEPLRPGSHIARFVRELFDDPAVQARAQEMEGILVVESDRPVVAVTLRQDDDPGKEFPAEVPILTTFPVIPRAPER